MSSGSTQQYTTGYRTRTGVKHWKQKTGHEHSSIKRRVQGMVEERRRAWQLRTETSGTENETDYTVSINRFIREVWNRAI
jgi:hypothetical protein